MIIPEEALEVILALKAEVKELKKQLKEKDAMMEIMHDAIHMWKERAEEKDKKIEILRAELREAKGYIDIGE